MTELELKALEIWRKREMQFPKFTRRMTPDAFDMESGAWYLVMQEAAILSQPEKSG